MTKTIKYYLAPLLIVIAIFTLFLFFNYRDIENNAFLRNTSHNHLFASNVQSHLHEIDLTLNTLAYSLLETENLSNTNENAIQKGMDQAPHFLGILLFTTGSDTLFLYDQQGRTTTPSAPSESLQQDMEVALKVDHMVAGDIYYSNTFEQWVIPFHKAFADSRGGATRVLSVIKPLNEILHQWGSTTSQLSQRSTIIKDNGHSIYSNVLEPEQYSSALGEDIPVHFFKNHVQAMAKTLSLSHQSNPGKFDTSFEFETVHPRSLDPCYLSITYNKTYKLWILSYLPMSEIKDEFLSASLYRLPFYLSALILVIIFLTRINKKERQKNSRLRHLALHDSLTDIYNRSALSSIFSQWAQENPDGFYLLHLDLDHFKSTNDNFGHSFGNQVLIEVSKRLKSIKPQSSDIVRYAGDEFSIFLKTPHEITIKDICQNLIKSLSQPYHIGTMTAYIGCSIGVSHFPDNGETHEDLITAADLALQKAKEKKNCYLFFSEQMQQEIARKSLLERDLRSAIQNDELFMLFQPQVDSQGTVFGAEALIRWVHPQLGSIGPDEFIGIAESTGLMPELGKFILKQSCQDFSEVKSQLGPRGEDLTLSINISVQQLFEKKFQKDLFSTLSKFHIKKENIVLEITESIFIDELDYTLPLLESTRLAGINISLDDFGTGYSSLSMLRTLPLDELKIDKAFINNINTEEQDIEMVRSIISMGQIMGLSIVAEGVEDIAQVELLESINCTTFQGYYFSKPLNKNELIALIKEQSQS